MGLLDTGIEDPQTAGLLSLGLRLMSTPGKFGTALGAAGLGALQDVNAVKAANQQRQAQALQQQMAALQLQQAKKQFETQNRIDALPSAAANPTGGIDQTRYLAGLEAIDPQKAWALKASLAKQAPKLEVVAKGGVGAVWDQAQGKYVPQIDNAQPEKDENRPEVLKLMTALQELPPGDPQRKLIMDRIQVLGSHNPQTIIDMKQPSAFMQGQGKEFSDMMGTINKQAFAAPSQMRKLERMQQLLEGVDGGKLAPLGLEVASAANAIGIKMDPKLGNKEAAQALAREIAGGFRQPGTGPMTDKDFENFLTQVPDLSKSAEGRRQITQTMKAALARDIALGKKAREYVARKGQLDNGFLDEAAEFIAQNPVVGMPQGWKVER